MHTSILLLTKTVGRSKRLKNGTAALVPYISNKSKGKSVQNLRKEQKKGRIGRGNGAVGRPPRESKFTMGLFFFSLIFWPCCMACGVLVPQLGIEPEPPAVEAQSLNHWTTREVPRNGS